MIELIESTLEKLIINSPSCAYTSLFEGARYSLLAPAKRIRPLLTLYIAEMLEPGSSKRALYPACSVEIVHSYSLIHDDLPCMDDDDMRRGRPTLHKVYNEGHAVLVGDYLLTYAFEVLAKAPLVSAEQKISLIQILAQSAGGEGMIGGQVMDIEKHEDISQLHQKKTAALFCCAVSFGGIITHASASIQEKLALFGTQFGEFFQMVDDIIDEDHPLGINRAKEALHELKTSMLCTLQALPGDHTPINTLIQKILNQ